MTQRLLEALPQIKLDAVQAFTFSLHRQHLLPGSEARSIEDVADRLVGIHAARLVTPFFALRARMQNLQYSDLHAALHYRRTLVKARCMRGTLHLLTRNVFSSAHQATLEKRLGVCRSLYRKLGLDAADIRKLKQKVLGLVVSEPKSASAIEQLLCNGPRRYAVTEDKFVVRAVIKELWERGELCYVNGSPTFGSEERLYGSMSAIYPAHTSAEYIDSSASALVRRYLRGYAPATVGDLTWWSGLDKTCINQALLDLSAPI